MTDEPDTRELMNRALLNTSSQLFSTDPLFHARCQITASVVNYACHSMGEKMTREIYSCVMQAAAVALVMAMVDDDELSESVDHGKILVSMLDFERASTAVAEERRKAAEEEL